MLSSIIISVIVLLSISGSSSVSWEEWWTYDGISGPSFWGLINPDWNLCNNGKRQSPINIDPKNILYDPGLSEISVDDVRVTGMLENTGHGIVFSIDTDHKHRVNISRGPVVYNYPIYSISIHFGQREDGSGSEHTIDGQNFVSEVQILGYNADLYDNETTASKSPHGLIAISVLLQVGDMSNVEMRKITKAARTIRYGGQTTKIQNFSLHKLLPETRGYITYEGSMTEPGCQETVTWIIMNRPIYITPQQLHTLRKLVQGEANDPRAPLGGNFRPIQPLNGRTMRTNIFVSSGKDSKCPTIRNNLEYKANKFQVAK